MSNTFFCMKIKKLIWLGVILIIENNSGENLYIFIDVQIFKIFDFLGLNKKMFSKLSKHFVALKDCKWSFVTINCSINYKKNFWSFKMPRKHEKTMVYRDIVLYCMFILSVFNWVKLIHKEEKKLIIINPIHSLFHSETFIW